MLPQDTQQPAETQPPINHAQPKLQPWKYTKPKQQTPGAPKSVPNQFKAGEMLLMAGNDQCMG